MRGAGGMSPRVLLTAFADEGNADPAWIRRASTDELAAQIDRLEARALQFLNRAAALQAMPLFGVPYAVRDSID
jgi:hypothetical protein